MQWVGLVAMLVVGYWISEWPRRFFAGESQGLPARELPNGTDRCAGRFFIPFVFVLTAVLTTFCFVAAWWFVPAMHEHEHLPFWALLLPFGACGIAVGVFEIGTGMTTEYWVFDASSEDQRFRVDPEMAQRVGSWRVFGCAALNILILVAARFLPL